MARGRKRKLKTEEIYYKNASLHPSKVSYSLSGSRRRGEEQSLLQQAQKRFGKELSSFNYQDLGKEVNKFTESLTSSYLNLILVLLVLLIGGILTLNYFRRDSITLGPAQTTNQTESQTEAINMEGQHIVASGETLYIISQKYYNDGFKYNLIAEANKLQDINKIEVGQLLEIPKLEAVAQITEEPQTITSEEKGTGGAINQTIWGEKIEGNKYTVIEGDWLSTISGRAYGDIMMFEKLAQANNIPDPNYILPGMVLNIPR